MRLIDADDFKAYIRRSYEEVKHMYRDDGKLAKKVTEAFCVDIDEQPTIEPPEIIKCKDCKWFNKPGCSIWIVDDSDNPSEDDYCSFAELRGDTDD